eukprot:jgi/Mesvir1/7433/Mv19214-RA.1
MDLWSFYKALEPNGVDKGNQDFALISAHARKVAGNHHSPCEKHEYWLEYQIKRIAGSVHALGWKISPAVAIICKETAQEVVKKIMSSTYKRPEHLPGVGNCVWRARAGCGSPGPDDGRQNEYRECVQCKRRTWLSDFYPACKGLAKSDKFDRCYNGFVVTCELDPEAGEGFDDWCNDSCSPSRRSPRQRPLVSQPATFRTMLHPC